MKKVLFLSSRLPYPPIGGDRLKNYWLLKILAKHFNIHLVSIVEDEIPPEFDKWAKGNNISYKLFFKRKSQFYFNTLKTFYNRLPLQVNYYYFRDVQNYIDSVYETYDLLFPTLVRTAKYVMNVNKPKILEMTDSVALNYLRSKEKTSSIKWKFIYTYESNKLLSFEKECVDKFDKVLLVNKEEAEFFNSDKVVWLPNGVNESLFSYKAVNTKYKNYIAFFGKMNYQPNIDAVLWFVKNVIPLLNKDLKFIIVGANPTKEILELEKRYDNIEVTGFVQDPYEILKSALCVVAPMQTGGGIQNKILESMALGTINIVSSLGAKPLRAKHMEHLFITDDPVELASLINDVYKNPKKYEYIKENAQKFIKDKFTWSIYEKKLLNIVDELI